MMSAGQGTVSWQTLCSNSSLLTSRNMQRKMLSSDSTEKHSACHPSHLEFKSWQCHSHPWPVIQESEIGHAIIEGGIACCLSPSNTSQSWLSMNLLVWKWVDRALLQVFCCPLMLQEQRFQKMWSAGFTWSMWLPLPSLDNCFCVGMGIADY